jgi:small-conductance mechanosensitive channel
VDEFVDRYLPAVLAVALLLATYIGGSRYLRRRADVKDEHEHIRAQALVALGLGIAVVIVILALPVEDDARNSLLQLFGLLVTAVIGLSATTHVSNSFAGLMLRSRRTFRPGDFIRFDGHFGRVTDMGLFHTELQTEDRDLTTVPNVALVSAPVTVIRATGTIISANVSLGYDVDRRDVEVALISAANAVGLVDPFVHVSELGDYSILYRVAGLLEAPKTLLTARSRLRGAMLDHLHHAGVEIVSPTFMNQRQIASEDAFVPDGDPLAPEVEAAGTAEDLIFDKADMAESVEKLRDRLAGINSRLEEMETDGRDEDVARLARTKEVLERSIQAREREKDQSN